MLGSQNNLTGHRGTIGKIHVCSSQRWKQSNGDKLLFLPNAWDKKKFPPRKIPEFQKFQTQTKETVTDGTHFFFFVSLFSLFLCQQSCDGHWPNSDKNYGEKKTNISYKIQNILP